MLPPADVREDGRAIEAGQKQADALGGPRRLTSSAAFWQPRVNTSCPAAQRCRFVRCGRRDARVGMPPAHPEGPHVIPPCPNASSPCGCHPAPHCYSLPPPAACSRIVVAGASRTLSAKPDFDDHDQRTAPMVYLCAKPGDIVDVRIGDVPPTQPSLGGLRRGQLQTQPLHPWAKHTINKGLRLVRGLRAARCRCGAADARLDDSSSSFTCALQPGNGGGVAGADEPSSSGPADRSRLTRWTPRPDLLRRDARRRYGPCTSACSSPAISRG